MKNFIQNQESDTLMSDLHSLISGELNCAKSFRTKFTSSSGKAIKSDPPKVSSKKRTVCDFDLDVDCELNTLILKYREKIQKAVAAVFDVQKEFDCVIVNCVSDDKDSVPYESFYSEEYPEFSPTIAVLSIGTNKMMYMKPKNSNSITHKVALYPNSLCLITGLTESKFRHSIPRNFGESDEKQMTIFFIEKVPADDYCKPESPEILSVNQVVGIGKITPPPSPITQQVDEQLLPPNESENISASKLTEIPDDKSDDKVIITSERPSPSTSSPVSDQSVKKPILERSKKVPSLDPLSDKTLVNSDEMDFEEDGCILLAGTLDQLVRAMNDQGITEELTRNKLSTTGSAEMKRRRLTTALHMKIGELKGGTSTIDPIKLMKVGSVDSVSHREFETISSTQNHIEDILKTVVDDLNDMKIELAAIRDHSVSAVVKQEISSTKNEQHVPGKLNNSIVECSHQIKSLTEQLSSVKSEIDETNTSLSGINTLVKNTRSDIEGWYASAFYHEEKDLIKMIYETLTQKVQLKQPVDDPQNQHCVHSVVEPQSGVEVVEKPENNVDNMPKPEDKDYSGKMKLCSVLKEKKKPIVCLITDSILRHVTSQDLIDRYTLFKFDISDSEGLSHQLLHNELKRLKPHFVYIHLGINDIQNSRSPTQIINNFAEFEYFLREHLPDVRVIFSLPLLNGRQAHSRSTTEIRAKLSELINGIKREETDAEYHLYIQYNNNFFKDEQFPKPRSQIQRLFDAGRLHLSTRGKMVITGNMRDAFYRITRAIRS